VEFPKEATRERLIICNACASNRMCADSSKWNQDTLFSVLVAARAVPRAALANAKLATSICELLPAAAPNFPALWVALALPPDLKNVVLEVAIARPPGCNAAVLNVTSILLDSAHAWVATEVANAAALNGNSSATFTQTPLLQHDRRNVAFVLAAAREPETLRWLSEEVAFKGGGGGMGLRAPDRVVLLEHIARGSVEGFHAVAAGAQIAAARWHAQQSAGKQEGVDEKEEGQVLRAAARLGALPKGGKLPGWVVEKGVLEDAALMRERQRLSVEQQAANVVCRYGQ
jgi:hypothetical protein